MYESLSDEEILKEKARLEFEIAKYSTLESATKTTLVSLYGALGTKTFRFYDVKLAEAVTLTGQLSNKFIEKHANEYLNKITLENKDYCIYQDTDSCFFTLNSLVKKFIPENTSDEKILEALTKIAKNKIQPEVDQYCSKLGEYLNFYNNRLSYKLEKICLSGIFVAKKRYAVNVYSNEGVVYSEPKIIPVGLEIKKSTTPKLVRIALTDCLKLILSGNEEALKSYVKSFKDKFFKLAPEEIAFPKGVNNMDKYYDSSMIYRQGTPIHVRGSLLYNKVIEDKNLHYELIKSGDKIKYLYLKLPNPIKENVIAFPDKLFQELGILQYIDYKLMFDKGFVEPLKRIADVAKMEIEKKYKLEDFFI